MTALYMVGDVFDRLAELRRRQVRVALVLCSPPFLALRSYLPDGHPLKRMEIGSEATPAAFVDVMLALVAECAHVLAPWGSVALELGDTYSGSTADGGDNRGNERYPAGRSFVKSSRSRSTGWPRDKSLAGIPEAVMLSLAYGYNVLDRRGPDSPAGRWMIRNFKPWIRSNPPVGALGDKERPATSYVIVATRDPARYFDLDAVRTRQDPDRTERSDAGCGSSPGMGSGLGNGSLNAAGAPPRDWCHSVDMVLDAELDRMAGKTNGGEVRRVGEASASTSRGNGGDFGNPDKPRAQGGSTVGARGVHLRRALERAGILTTLDALDVSPKGYRGAHYAVWPPELVRLLVDEMCPRRVCSVCGQPSRRIVETERRQPKDDRQRVKHANGERPSTGRQDRAPEVGWEIDRQTVGWSDCGCPGDDRWQPGTVLDPFAGSGTTLAVCSGMGRESIGIDLDYTNVELAIDRVGVFLDVEWPEPDWGLLERRALGAGSPHPAYYDRWRHQLDSVRAELAVWLLACMVAALAAAVGAPLEGDDIPDPIPAPRARNGRKVPAMVGQGSMFDHPA